MLSSQKCNLTNHGFAPIQKKRDDGLTLKEFA